MRKSTLAFIVAVVILIAGMVVIYLVAPSSSQRQYHALAWYSPFSGVEQFGSSLGS